MSGLKRRKHSKARLLCFSGRMLSRHAEGVAGTAVGEGKKSVFWLAAVAFGMSHRPTASVVWSRLVRMLKLGRLWGDG